MTHHLDVFMSGKKLRLNGLSIRYYILNIYLKLHYVTSLIKKKKKSH